MKPTILTYLHEAIHLARNWGVNQRVEEGISKKLPQNAMKFRKFPL